MHFAIMHSVREKYQSEIFMNENQFRQFVKKTTTLMWISFGIWIWIVIQQFFIGILTLVFGYGIGTLILMVYNLVMCIRFAKNINIIKDYRTKQDAAYLVNYFEKSIPICWIFMFLNLLLGGFVGFFGNLYDLIIAYYVKGKKKELLAPAYNAPFNNAPVNAAPVYSNAPVNGAPVFNNAPNGAPVYKNRVNAAPVYNNASVNPSPVYENASVNEADVYNNTPVNAAPVYNNTNVNQAPVSGNPVNQADNNASGIDNSTIPDSSSDTNTDETVIS